MDDRSDTMQGETGASTDKPGMGDTDTDNDATEVFLPKAALGGETYKPGDTITLKVTDIDPETGDVSAVCSDDDTSSSGGGMMDDFDSAMDKQES